MKAKISSILFLLLIVSLFTLPKLTKAQDEMDFEEFMGAMSATLSDSQLDELSYQLPWDIKVTAYAYGDFSGHGLKDFVIAVKEKDVTPLGSVDVYFLQNIGDVTYSVVKKKNYKYVEIPLEVAFIVQYGECFVTNRDKGNWYFTGYKIDEDDNSLVQVEREIYPLSDFEHAGK